MNLSRLARYANHVNFACDTYKYPSINYIAREDRVLVWRDVNVSGPEQGMPIFFIQALKSKSFETSQLRLLIEVFFQNEHDIAMSGVF